MIVGGALCPLPANTTKKHANFLAPGHPYTLEIKDQAHQVYTCAEQVRIPLFVDVDAPAFSWEKVLLRLLVLVARVGEHGPAQ